MRKPRQKSIEIRSFIVENVSAHPKDISALVINQFGISRPAVLGHIQKLIDEGVLEATGTTRARRYELKLLVDQAFFFNLSPDAEEDKIWHHLVRPLLHEIPENVMRICEYGMNEMINNAIDHSEGTKARIHVRQSAAQVKFHLRDNGVGIFNKIQRDFGFDDPRQAILELSKGKLTTDPSRHTGEGIFFVSRMFDRFVVFSDELFFSPNDIARKDIPGRDDPDNGTGVKMNINTRSKRTTQEIFSRYASEDDDYRFSKTDVPVYLAKFGSDNLVSRSQARRLLARLHEFRLIILDFTGIDSIGQAFADEIFRVYLQGNPDIEISAINTNHDIDKMIRRVISEIQ